jgi:hypothetical protein
MMYADWRSIPIPKRMKALGRDKRGFPIPFTVLRDTDGCPHFAANDGIRQHKARYESRCQICGGKLDSLKWLVGGPPVRVHGERCLYGYRDAL